MSLPTTNVNDILLNFKHTTVISMDFVNKHDLIDIVGFFFGKTKHEIGEPLKRKLIPIQYTCWRLYIAVKK